MYQSAFLFLDTILKTHNLKEERFNLDHDLGRFILQSAGSKARASWHKGMVSQSHLAYGGLGRRNERKRQQTTDNPQGRVSRTHSGIPRSMLTNLLVVFFNPIKQIYQINGKSTPLIKFTPKHIFLNIFKYNSRFIILHDITQLSCAQLGKQ